MAKVRTGSKIMLLYNDRLHMRNTYKAQNQTNKKGFCQIHSKQHLEYKKHSFWTQLNHCPIQFQISKNRLFKAVFELFKPYLTT